MTTIITPPGIPVDGQPIEDPVVEPPVGISPPPPIPPWVSQPPHVFLDPPTTPRFKVPIPEPVADLFTVKHEDDPGHLMPNPGVLYNDGLPYINGRTTYATPDPTWTDVPDSLWRAWATRLALAVNDALNEESTTEIPAIFAPVYFRYLADKSRDEVSISSPDKGLLFCPSGSGSGLELYNIYGVEVASNPPKHLDAADYDGEFIWVDAQELADGMATFSGGLTAADPSPDDLTMVQIHRTPRRPKELMSFRVAWEGDMTEAEAAENTGWEGIEQAAVIRNRIISAIGEDPIFSAAWAGTAYVLQHPPEGEMFPIDPAYTGFAAGGAADTSIGVSGAVIKLTGATGAITNEVYWRFCPAPDTAFGSILQIDGGELLPIPLFNEPAATPELEAFRIWGTRQALIVGAATAGVAGAPLHVFHTWELGNVEASEQANAAFALPPLSYPEEHWGMMHEGYGASWLLGPLPDDMSARIPLSEDWLETSPPIMIFRDATTGEVVDPTSYQDGSWEVTRSYYRGVIFNAHYIPVECDMVKLCDSEERLLPQSELSTEIAVATAYVQERWPEY